MSFQDLQTRRRIAAIGSLVVVLVALLGIALSSGGSGSGSKQASAAGAKQASPLRRSGAGSQPAGSADPRATAVPILMYNVINVPPPGASSPELYVPAAEFTAQMQALKAAGWHAVTLDQLRSYWTGGASLGPGRPIVLSFDTGYASQSANALPVLKQLGWIGVENLQLGGLPPSQGGLTDDQVKGFVAAGWELDTQGISPADPVTVDPVRLRSQIETARQTLRSRYGVSANWFSYPSGHYNLAVIDAVRSAGFVGSTTVVPGWASSRTDPFRLPRLRVLSGTSPAQLLAQIASAQADAPAPAAYTGP